MGLVSNAAKNFPFFSREEGKTNNFQGWFLVSYRDPHSETEFKIFSFVRKGEDEEMKIFLHEMVNCQSNMDCTLILLIFQIFSYLTQSLNWVKTALDFTGFSFTVVLFWLYIRLLAEYPIYHTLCIYYKPCVKIGLLHCFTKKSNLCCPMRRQGEIPIALGIL